MKIGILELLAFPSKSLSYAFFDMLFTKQCASITPQVISVWCRELGHEPSYAIYYGVGEVRNMLPEDMDIVFITCYSRFAPLAYSLAKLYRKAGVQTVIGGPHATSFPQDCLRFFDIVVKHCDKNLLRDILTHRVEPGSFISSSRAFSEMPSVEEREPEIRTASFFRQRWRSPLITIIPLLSSMGCPFSCNFCTDWDTPYYAFAPERLTADVRYVAQRMRGSLLAFGDPNFAINFDGVVNALESIPPALQVPYIMECSLNILNEAKITRLQDTGCIAGAFGIESWNAYTKKTVGSGKRSAQEKLHEVVSRFEQLKDHIPYLQAQFIFGLDHDEGDEPVALIKEFMTQTPYVWPVINVPVPFGGTPFYEHLLREGRILTPMPFVFYYAPFLVIKPKKYGPIEYFEKLIELSSCIVSDEIMTRRLHNTDGLRENMFHKLRVMVEKDFCRQYRELLALLRSDSQFLAFHEGRSTVLPHFYRQRSRELVGNYAHVLSDEEWIPDLTSLEPLVV